ncbi:MAG: hypothetical protein WBH88_02350 [Candidatus Methanoculleus thermohydrogenotrophicum]
MMKVVATSRLIARQICSMGLRFGGYGGRYTGGILFLAALRFDQHRMVRTEVIQHDDQPFPRVCLPERSRKVMVKTPLTPKMPTVLARVFAVFFTNGVRSNDHMRWVLAVV